MNYDDYYNEYSEIDQLIMELKDSALKGAKQDIKDKLERLEKENKELKEVKDNWQKLENDYKNKTRELEQKTEQAIRDSYKTPIKEMMEKVQEEYYQLSRKSAKYPKCDKCDADRYLHLIDDYGREHKIPCECDKTYPEKYVVETKYMIGIECISKRNDKPQIWVNLSYMKPYDAYSQGYYHNGEILNENLIKNWDDFETKKEKDNSVYYKWLFMNKKDAQKYADNLNKIKEK